jgi:hypothetical protein
LGLLIFIKGLDEGIDMAELFKKTGETISTLRDGDSDSGPDSLASILSPQLSDHVSFLSDAAQTELECKGYNSNLA